MRLRNMSVLIVFVVLLLAGLTPAPGSAAPVGTFVQVEGSVELMKQGKLPAIPAKVQDKVEPLDIIRTKSKSRAQVKFIDDTLLTIAPSSSISIQEYFYDGAKGTRRATLQVMRGLMYTVVNRIYQTEQPDFVVKTHTAVLGVRGTRFFTLVGVRYSAFLQEAGRTEVSNILSSLPQKVNMIGQEYTIVKTGQAPLAPRRCPDADLIRIRKWLLEGIPERFLELDPVISIWESTPGSQVPMPQGPEQLPEGLFKPPTVTPHPSSPGHTN